jgi:hypothetical protein
MPEPLDGQERAFARVMHFAVRAVKTCEGCGTTKRIDQFPGYGAAACKGCARGFTLESLWAKYVPMRAAG